MQITKRNREYWQNVWAHFRDGNTDAFSEIYNEFVDVLFTYGTKISPDRELVKDAIQDLFIDLYRYNNNLRKPESLEFYLFKALKRLLIKRMSKQQRLAGRITSEAVFSMQFDLEAEMIEEDSQERKMRLLQDMLKALDPQKRELLFLKFNSGLSYQEIGTLMDMNPETAKKQVYRMLSALREKFSERFLELFFFCSKA